jgi:methylated-DNA-[protein]-cysteine S-methyltransferase
MADAAKYTIFKTKWGYFGLVADKKGLFRTCLPCPSKRKRRRACPSRKTVENRLLSGLDNVLYEKNLLKSLQDDIVAYFNGQTVKFDVPLGFNNLPRFMKKVLDACKRIPPGKTTSYSQLARMIGKPRAGRAVGNALAKNPVPLIIPCHRVIHSDGSLGNFSAPGGTNTKKKLITLESNEH